MIGYKKHFLLLIFFLSEVKFLTVLLTRYTSVENIFFENITVLCYKKSSFFTSGYAGLILKSDLLYAGFTLTVLSVARHTSNLIASLRPNKVANVLCEAKNLKFI